VHRCKEEECEDPWRVCRIDEKKKKKKKKTSAREP